MHIHIHIHIQIHVHIHIHIHVHIHIRIHIHLHIHIHIHIYIHTRTLTDTYTNNANLANQLPFRYARTPFLERVANLPEELDITFIYGAESWMDSSSGIIARSMRPASQVDVVVLEGAGHHVYSGACMGTPLHSHPHPHPTATHMSPQHFYRLPHIAPIIP